MGEWETFVLNRVDPRSEDGFTMVEMIVATALLSAVMAMAMGVLASFMRSVEVQGSLLATERAVRPELDDLIRQVRQSEPQTAQPTDHPVTELAWNRLVITSERFPFDGAPERSTYELINCVSRPNGNTCDLRRTTLSPDAGSAPNYTYSPGVDSRQRIVMERVVASAARPLFRGTRWTGSPPARTNVSTCSDATALCAFTLLTLDLRVDPREQATDLRLYEVREEVRLRNVEID